MERSFTVQLSFVFLLSWFVAATSAHADGVMTSADLKEAFAVAFGGPAPLARLVDATENVSGSVPSLRHSEKRMFHLTPERLVALGDSRWALLVNETATGEGEGYPGYAMGGALAVAYLTHNKAWKLDHLWLEAEEFGIAGEPGNAGTEIHQFGGSPLYFATNEWCGMGECSDQIIVIALQPSGPRSLGWVEGGAVYPVDPGDNGLDDTCESYKYHVRIVPPVSASNQFGIVYEGWTAPPGKQFPKHWFYKAEDAVALGAHVAMKPKLKIPDCAR